MKRKKERKKKERKKEKITNWVEVRLIIVKKEKRSEKVRRV